MMQATSTLSSIYEERGDNANAESEPHLVAQLDNTVRLFEYKTLTGNIIRSVVPHSKGANTNYKVNQGYVRPFGALPGAPPVAAPKSPISYPPLSSNTYVTLPRTNAGQQGRNAQYSTSNTYSSEYSTQYRKPQKHVQLNKYATMPHYRSSIPPENTGNIDNYNKNSNNCYNRDGYNILEPDEKESCEPLVPPGAAYYEENSETKMFRQTRNNFSWPPFKDEEYVSPTAAPLYIQPPEKQHGVTRSIQDPPPLNDFASNRTVKSKERQLKTNNLESQIPTRSDNKPQSKSLYTQQLPGSIQSGELESSSDCYTSPFTTESTSDEYQRTHAALMKACQTQPITDQSGSELEFRIDMDKEMAAMQKNQIHSSNSGSREYISGCRSAQECVESLVTPLSTYKLVDMVRDVTPSPVVQVPPVRRVVFVDEPEVNVLFSSQSDQEKDFSCSEEDFSSSYLKQAASLNDDSNAQIKQKTFNDGVGLLIENRSHILESQRLFQPTPEIKIEIPRVRHIPPTKIANPTPKLWINPMVRALTTAPEVPFHIVDCLCPKPCECECQEDATEKQNTSQPCAIRNLERGLIERPSSSELSKDGNILPETPFYGTKSTKLIEASELPINIEPPPAGPVSLPEETVPYMPPPIDMKPYIREDYRPKSPFLNALLIAPEKPFESHFDRDVPIHDIDLPTPKAHLTMSDALCVAPYRSYTPLNPENNLHIFEGTENERERKTEEIVCPDLDQQKNFESIVSSTEYVQYYVTENSPELSTFAAMQAFKPSRERLKTPPASQNFVISLPKDETDLEYEKYYKAEERNKKRLDYFHKKEEELKQQHQFNTCLSTTSSSSLTFCGKASNSFSTVQQMPAKDKTSSLSAHYDSSCYQGTRSSVKTQKLDTSEVIEETAEELEHSEVLFPPPSPLSHLRTKLNSSGLHKPKSIPKYQRNWTVLPTQSPARTPEPPELRENIPLAFVDTPKSPSTNVACNIIYKPLAQIKLNTSNLPITTGNSTGFASTILSEVSKQNHMVEESQQQELNSFIIEDRPRHVTMAFQSIKDHLSEDSIQTVGRPFTPSLINKSAPIIPFYQTPEKLCFDECPAQHARAYDRRSVSPFADRSRSPASGPPPNPLSVIRAPRMKETELSSLSPRVLTTGSITTGQSYLGAQQSQKIQSEVQSGIEMGSQMLSQEAVAVNEPNLRNLTEKKSQMENKKRTETGNTKLEHRSSLKEEENLQKIKTTEIRRSFTQDASTEPRETYRKTGFVSNEARRLSSLEEEISNLQIQSKAISERAANLSETVFPQFHSSTSTSRFPTRPVFPSHDEPRRPSYVLQAGALAPPHGSFKQNKTSYGASIKITQPPEELNTLNCPKKTTSSFLSSSSLTSSKQKSNFNSAASDCCSLTKASCETNNNNNKNAYSMKSSASDASGICLITGALCCPDQTCCKPQQINMQQQPNVSQSNSNNFNNTYRSIASAGLTSSVSAATNTAPKAYDKTPTFESENNNTGNNGSSGTGGKTGVFGATSVPKRGRGIYNKAVAPGVRVPLCNSCNMQIRGPFITALGRIWCPDHFICVNGNCRRPLQDIGFVEEKGDLYCEYCFEKYLAPTCSKCSGKIKGDCLNAIGKHFHPECFTCGHCGKMFGNTPFFLEDGNAYCEADWNELFTTKCFSCGFPVEAGDRWVEALNHNYHSQCFNCTYCKQNLEGQSFYNKGGRPFCKNHAR